MPPNLNKPKPGRRLWAALSFARENWVECAAIILVICARVFLLPVIPNSDVPEGYGPWYDDILKYGRVKAWGRDISDYAPTYLYLLSAASLLPFHKFVNIKIIPMIFDLWTAWVASRLVKTVRPTGPWALLAGIFFLISPTVMANSALWGQVDTVYTGFLLLGLLQALKMRPVRAVLAVSVAAALKLQALFFLPALALLFLERGWALAWFSLLPVGYVILSLPAIIAGRPVVNVMTVYFRQIGSQEALVASAASLYQWLPQANPRLQGQAGLFFAAAVCAFFIAAIRKLATKRLSTQNQIAAALLMAALPPFLLPNMHERYAYCSDALAAIIPFVAPTLTLPAAMLTFASLASYGPFLRHDWMPLQYAAMLNAVAIFLIARYLARSTGMLEQTATYGANGRRS